MKKDFPINVTVPIIAGLVFIATGILLNEWFLAALFSSDGKIAFNHKVVIWIVDFCLIGTGFIVIRYRRLLTKEKILFLTGLFIISAGLLFNERYLSVLLTLDMNNAEKIIVRILDLYLIVTGFLVVVFRKSMQLKNLILVGISSLICFTSFLSFDFYRAYALLNSPHRQSLSESIHVKDPRLAWKPKPDCIVRHMNEGNFDVTYEIDHNGFKKINNSVNPDFSIYFFGNSFTFGHGVDNQETFSAIIKEKYLREDVNVYNAGVMGYGIVQMFQRFLSMKDRIQQGDLVIFTPLCVDIKRNVKDFIFPYWVYFKNITRIEYYPYFENGVIKQHKIEDSFYNKLKLLALIAPWTKNFWQALNHMFIPDTTLESIEMMKIIKHETEMKAGKFALFFLPRPEECLQREYCLDVSRFQYFDIMHFFPAQKEELYKLVFNNDRHWNVKGHEITAKAIVETLINAGIIDGQFVIQN
jgi:hypothetical protein